MDIWIVVEIDEYDGDGDGAGLNWTRNYAGLEVYTSEKKQSAPPTN